MSRAPSRLRPIICAICASEFQARHSQAKYCSPECAHRGELKSWRMYGKKNRESRLQYHRVHYAANAKRIGARIKTYHQSPAGKRAQKVSDIRQRQKFPEKVAARNAVRHALASGRLVRQPCRKCSNLKTEAHHHDYGRPLDVVWLCSRCHREEHKQQEAA